VSRLPYCSYALSCAITQASSTYEAARASHPSWPLRNFEAGGIGCRGCRRFSFSGTAALTMRGFRPLGKLETARRVDVRAVSASMAGNIRSAIIELFAFRVRAREPMKVEQAYREGRRPPQDHFREEETGNGA